MAKCSSREEGEREDQLDKLAEAVGFEITRIQPVIADDPDAEADLKAKISGKKMGSDNV